MHLILPDVKENFEKNDTHQASAMHHMCKHLLKGCALWFFQKEMQYCERKREGYIFYVLQRISCTYISSDLCLLLKIHLYDIDFSFLVRELGSKRVFHLLE